MPATDVPLYVEELRRLTGDETLTLPAVEQAIEEASSAYNHFLDLYVTGRLPSMADAWRLIALRRGIPPELIQTASEEEVAENLRRDEDITVTEVAYRSSVSDLQPLYAEICYDPDGRDMPIAVVQHGGSPGSRFGTVPTCYRMATKGMFAISVSKRGRDGSAGSNDTFGVETFDIIDAVEHVKREYARHVDPTNVNIWGYSGGCIDSVAAALRFPDYFRLVVPYFGQLDWTAVFSDVPAELRAQHAQHAAAGERDKSISLVDGIGGFPDEVPDRYLARNLLLGVRNNPYSQFHFFLDAKDPSGPVLQEHFKEYARTAQALGFDNVRLHLSQPGDIYRWHHMHPGHWAELCNPDLLASESFYVPRILAGSYPEPVLADGGEMTVLGFLQTRRFSVWLGNGDDAVADLSYALTPRDMYFSFRAVSSDPRVHGRLTVPNPAGRTWTVHINGAVEGKSSESEINVDFDLDDSVILRRTT